jgi:hypothetical protein
MDTTKLHPQTRPKVKRSNPREACTPDSAPKTERRSMTTTEDVVNELLRMGVPLDQIIIPEPDEEGFNLPDNFNDPFSFEGM